MSEIVLDVTGYPAPQGSKKAWVNKATGRAQMREQASERIGLWRQDVKAAAFNYIARREGTGDPFATLSQPVAADIVFRFPRPKSHFRTGRYAHLLRDNAPVFPTTRSVGDVDKLIRATLDALTVAGILADDSQVVHVDAWKIYVLPAYPGARIILRTRPSTLAERDAEDEALAEERGIA